MWQVGPRISWLTQGLPTLSWPSNSEPSPPKPVWFGVLKVKQLQKDSLKDFFVAGMDKCLPSSFWWSLSVLLPYWKEIFPCLWNLASLAVLIEDALKLSLGVKLTIFTSQQVKQLLNGRRHLWMLDQWKQWDAVFLGSKVTSDGDCSHEIKRHLLLGRKAMTNLDSILKSRDITLLTKICLVKLWFFQWSRMDVRAGP